MGMTLDREGRPRFDRLMFNRRAPVYVVFDVLCACGQDVRDLPLRKRKAILNRIAADRCNLIVTNGVVGKGSRLFQKVCELDLEGIVANRMSDPSGPDTIWFKMLNRAYSQKEGQEELFERR
jgi:ATP-dependent DNA ligase